MVVVSSAGHSGAASATWEHVHRPTSRSQRCCRPKRRMYLWRAKDRLACRFRLDGSMEASRLHAAVKSEPVCGDHSACRRYMRAFQSQAIARNPRLVDFGALSSPYWGAGRARTRCSIGCSPLGPRPPAERAPRSSLFLRASSKSIHEKSACVVCVRILIVICCARGMCTDCPQHII